MAREGSTAERVRRGRSVGDDDTLLVLVTDDAATLDAVLRQQLEVGVCLPRLRRHADPRGPPDTRTS